MSIGNLQIGRPSQTAASAVIKASPGALLGIFCSSSTAGTAVVYDSATAATNNLAVNTFTLVAGTYHQMNMDFANGIYIVIGGTTQVTAVYV